MTRLQDRTFSNNSIIISKTLQVSTLKENLNKQKVHLSLNTKTITCASHPGD
jgi:hypothetical protein